jgi:hypothetical protein
MDAALRALVWKRAKGRCEYCRVHQDDADFLTFHVEHIWAVQHKGLDSPRNLCLACSECNWSKGPNLSGLLKGEVVPLFNPRRQRWGRHFRWKGPILIGKTRSGKVTVKVLNINDPARVMLRQNLFDEGRFPPEDD